ncbi:unnamed protein product [Rhodiola kirilowii]
MESVECASHDHPSMEITMAAVSLETVEESPTGQHLLQQDVLSETKSEEFVKIDMPSNLSPTPKKVYEEDSSVGVSSTPNSEYQSGTLSMEEVAVLASWKSTTPSIGQIDAGFTHTQGNIFASYPNSALQFKLYR